MKNLLLLLAVTAIPSVSLKAQGTVNFANSDTTRVRFSTNAGATSGNIPVGSTAWVAGLYWGPLGTAEGSLNLLGTTMTWQPISGVFNGGTLTVPSTPGGTRITFQVRAWSAGYASYETAAAALAAGNQSVLVGKMLGLGTVTLGGQGTPAALPGGLVNSPTPTDTPMTGFTVVGVPEPSTIALGLLGLGAIALFRRRK